MTASINRSGTCSTMQKAENACFISSNSSALTFSLGQIAVIPSPTMAGVLGMVRISFTGLPNCCSMAAISCPAAMVTTTVSSVTTGAISSITDG